MATTVTASTLTVTISESYTLNGVSYGNKDWSGIYDNELDYPGKFENFDKENTEDDVNVNNYRNK